MNRFIQTIFISFISIFLTFAPLIAQKDIPIEPNEKAQTFLVSLDSLNFPTVYLGEVMIKSARSERPLQELPISTSLVPSSQVEQEQIKGLTDLTTRVPNLYMPSYGSKLTSPIYIRGIGSRINNPAIGLYVDYIPQFDKSSFDFEFFDIERIEVLRGPQGTLYGRNNMGGLIHIFTQSPQNAPLAIVSAGVGNYGAQTFNLQLNHPINANTDIQISGQSRQRDGYFENTYNNRMADKLDAYSGRFRLLHRWNEKFNTDFLLSYENSDQDGYPYGVIDKATGNLKPVNYNEPSSYLRDLASAGLVNSLALGDLTLRSTTSAQYIDDQQTIDQDFTPDAKYLVTQPQTQYIFSQEMTAAIEKEGFKTTFGLFGFLRNMDKTVGVDLGSDYSTHLHKTYDHQNLGLAAFAQATLNNFMTKNLSMTAGLRVDWERTSQEYYYDKRIQEAVTPVDSTDSQMHFSELLPRLTFDYQLTNKLNAYLSLTKGYKTGGFNSTFERPEDQTFEAEHSWNYEAGLKSKWLFNQLRFSLTAFYIDWKNQQVYQPVPSGRGSMLTNAGRSESRGVEAQVSFRPVSYLETTLNVGNTRAVFKEYQKNASTNLSGNYLPYAPETTLYLGQNIIIPVKRPWLEKAIVNLNYQGIGKLYWNDENSAHQNYYGLCNGSATLWLKNIELTVWAKNIFNSSYQVFRFTALGNDYAQSGIPAILGTQIKMTF